MIISRLVIKNWRNFRKIDVNFRDRVFIIGPNASGKSNLLDVFRFLRDVAKPDGGGLQAAVKLRGGITKLRCLLARKDTEVLIDVYLADRADVPPKWRYVLGFRSEGKGAQRVIITQERVEDLSRKKVLLNRPETADAADTDRLTQTFLQQTNVNREFREIAEFFTSLTYLHLVPQLLKYPELRGTRLEGDPFGQEFLERIAKTTERVQLSRLRRIEQALHACVPNMKNLKFVRDEIGVPHLEALYEHWRPDAGWQREDQFSDGTLRLLGIMWSLLEGDSLLLLEEPELSLNEDIVRQIYPLIWKLQRDAKYRRQVFVTTHSEALIGDKGLDPREIIRLESTSNGTEAHETSTKERELIAAGYSAAEVLLTKVRPQKLDQLLLFDK